MKKTLLLLLAAGVLAGCGTKNEAVVEGTVTGLDDGTIVFLQDNNDNKIDSVALAQGTFRFELKKAYPDRAYISFGDNRRLYPFFCEPGTIRFMADLTDGGKVVVTGTPTNDLMKAMNDETAVFDDRMKELSPKLTELQSRGLNETPEFDSLANLYVEAREQRQKLAEKAVQENPNTILAAFLLNQTAYNHTTPEKMDSVLNLVAQAPKNAFTDRLRERREVLARTAVGQPAPDFTQNRPDGTPFSLSSLKGKLVLIDFWASWCGPCRAENPNVVRIYNRFKDDGFEIVGVSLDSNRDEWLKGIEEDGLTWIHVSDVKFWDNAVAKEYGVRSIPHTVLVSPEGIILAKNLRGEELEQKIAQTLGVTE